MKQLMHAAALGALLISTAACEDTTGTGGLGVGARGTTSLTFAAVGAPGFVSASVFPDSTVVGGHVIALTKAELRLSKIEIEGDSLEIEMKGGTTIVGLPLNGGITTPVTVPLLPGTYDKLELKIEGVRLQGTFDGEPFDVNVRVMTELETRLNPPIVVTASGTENVTVTFSAASWFLSHQGAAIDPRNLTPQGAEQLMANIKASMHGFDDHDRDGDHDDADDDHRRRNENERDD